MNKIKNLVHKIFNHFGYKLVGKKDIVKHNSFNAIHRFILNELLNTNTINIFDIGANDGGSIKRFSKYFPKSKIFSFEPTEHLFNKIKNQFNSEKVKIFNYAVGEKDELKDFYLYDYHKINSFYPMVNHSKYKIKRTKKNNKSDEIKKKVKVIKIDDFVKEKNISSIDLLKIDTQGAETEVLAGAKNCLIEKKIKIIELEYILGVAHEFNNSFYKIEEFLQKNDYKLIAIDHADNVISFSNYQTNLIYVNKDIYNLIQKFHEKNTDVKNVTHSVRHYEKI